MQRNWVAFEELSKTSGEEWPHIRGCKLRSDRALVSLADSVAVQESCPADTALVVYGSLARGEYTDGSDVDWTLLVDGQADEMHSQAPHGIRDAFRDLELAQPRAAGAFGALSFSHDLVHRVGGELDTNRNTTQRVLMLLESCAPVGGEVRDRVMRQVLGRYLGEDRENLSPDRRVPRYLLNDIVRFWRTMAVDFPAKQRDRGGNGWAIRNLKLRLSRKLIFASGLVACLDFYLKDESGGRFQAMDFLLERMNSAPIEVLAAAAHDYEARKEVVSDLFGAYDTFLGILDDPGKRNGLAALGQDEAQSDATYQVGKAAAERFQVGLMSLFFETNDELTEACQRYGVF